MLEQAVTFRNQKGELLFGILHVPEAPLQPRIGVNVLNPGLKNRVAPNRINVKMARMFCKMGFYVLRFDPAGVGDSEGVIPAHDSIIDIWARVQRGLFVGDTVAANRWFVEQAQLENVIMVGQCGGAVTALLAAESDTFVESLVLVDCSVRLLSPETALTDIMLETKSSQELGMYYLRKVFNPWAWLKLLQFKSDFRGLGVFLCSIVSKVRKNRLSGSDTVPGVSERFNHLIWAAFSSLMIRKKKVCFIFAEKDFSLREFEQDMKMGLLARSPQYNSQYMCYVVKDANHVYTEQKWQRELLQYISSWMSQYQSAC